LFSQSGDAVAHQLGADDEQQDTDDDGVVVVHQVVISSSSRRAVVVDTIAEAPTALPALDRLTRDG
jgi:hypothetical protein